MALGQIRPKYLLRNFARDEGSNLISVYTLTHIVVDSALYVCIQLLVLDQGSWSKLTDHSPLPLV